MKYRSLFASVLVLVGASGCSKLFISYCDRVAQGTAEQNWILDANTNTIPFSKASYREPAAICVTAQGETKELAAGKNFAVEISDSNDKVLVKKVGSAYATPINTENQLKLWGGTNQTNKNKFESLECFNIPKLDPYVKVKVKKLSTGETDEAKVWNNKAYCKR